MLVLLPPSESKTIGGTGMPLAMAALSFPELHPLRDKLAGSVVELANDIPTSRTVLGLSERQDDEIHRNVQLLTSPTLPAIFRYSGVLYDALAPNSLTKAELARAYQRLAVMSALFGLIRCGDPIPAYRLSAGSRLPGFGTLASTWSPELTPLVNSIDELVVDLRSGPYAALAKVSSAVTVRVVAERNGIRTAVSHHNKATKGRFARSLICARREPQRIEDLLTVASSAGLIAQQTGERSLDLLYTD